MIILQKALPTAVTLIPILQMGNVAQRRGCASDLTVNNSQGWGSKLDLWDTKVHAPFTMSPDHDEKCSLYALCHMLCAKICKER